MSPTMSETDLLEQWRRTPPALRAHVISSTFRDGWRLAVGGYPAGETYILAGELLKALAEVEVTP